MCACIMGVNPLLIDSIGLCTRQMKQWKKQYQRYDLPGLSAPLTVMMMSGEFDGKSVDAVMKAAALTEASLSVALCIPCI